MAVLTMTDLQIFRKCSFINEFSKSLVVPTVFEEFLKNSKQHANSGFAVGFVLLDI